MIEVLTSLPKLAYADYKLPFSVNIDVSVHGLGAVLYQKHRKELIGLKLTLVEH